MVQHCRFVTVNVFTSQPFSGNPLAIVFLPEASDSILSTKQKLLITREFNLSETIFVYPGTDFSSQRIVDIFTPATELPFAGHPVIGASSWLLNSTNPGDRDITALVTKSGRIPISLAPPRFQSPSEVSAEVAHNVRLHKSRFPLDELLRLHSSLAQYFTDSTDFPIFSIVNGMTQVHVELPSLAALAAVRTSNGGEFIPGDARYLDEGWASHHLVIYFFLRDVGDPILGRKVIRARAVIGQLEDPATGSAACGLGTYLALTTGSPGLHRLDIVQGVEMGRRSEIGIDVLLGHDGQVESVKLLGSAVEVSEGRILVPSPG